MRHCSGLDEGGLMFLDSSTDSGSSIGTAIVSLLVLGLAVLVYFLPSIIANARHNINTGAVLVINIFLGWTFIGWVVALAMAAGGQTQRQISGRAGPGSPLINPDGASFWDGQAWRPLPPPQTQGPAIIPPPPPPRS